MGVTLSAQRVVMWTFDLSTQRQRQVDPSSGQPDLQSETVSNKRAEKRVSDLPTREKDSGDPESDSLQLSQCL